MTRIVKSISTALLAIAVCAAAATMLLTAPALAQSKVSTLSSTSRFAGDFEVPVNKSQILRVDKSFKDVLVGNSEIADVVPLTNRTLYILGKKLGSTSLSIYGPGKRLLAIVDLVVTHNVDGLKSKIFELFPDEKIEVRAVNDAIVLSGAVSSTARMGSILELAERFAPDKVTNMMAVGGSQQVMLAVRFAEIKRTAFKELGINLQVLARTGAETFALLSGFPVLDSVPGTGFFNGGATVAGIGAGGDFVGLLDALEQKGVIKTLAEPNLIALSGDTASFLAGGEFPIPVAQNTSGGGSTITIEFKEFGVSLAFTPTVLSNGLISLEVAPEVSAIDNSRSFQLNGLLIPGLTTRRAKTTIELRDGQSFSIAGLLQSEFKDSIDQLPFAGDVPVLGALFRSSDYLRDETELVIIVTPYLVKPVSPKDLKLPTDSFALPSDVDLFLMGKPEGDEGKPEAAGSAKLSRAPAGGGLDGNIGHIIK